MQSLSTRHIEHALYITYLEGANEVLLHLRPRLAGVADVLEHLVRILACAQLFPGKI